MIPEHYTEIDLGMSNLDHVIDIGFEEEIKNNPVYGRHAGWNFNGLTYYLEGKFYTDVWVYGSHRSTIVCDTLQELFDETNEQYGWE